MRIGAKLPNSGALPLERGIPELARALEDAGFDSLWVSDHIVLPRVIESRYPFAADGRATWPTDTPYVDALVALALAAAVTERVALGTAVLVVQLRRPVVAAKQLASIDVASGGRLRLGVGVGWLREEFEVLGVDFETRASQFEEWIEVVRACWTGTPPAFHGRHYSLPADTLCLPAPARSVPVFVGGHSGPALRRAGRLGDGWLGQQALGGLDTAELEAARRTAGRGRPDFQVVLRIVEAAGRFDELARRLPELGSAGVDEVIVDVDWAGAEPVAQLEQLRAAVA